MNQPLVVSIRSKLLGAALRHARLRAGLFPEEASAALGCDASQIDAYETGRLGISLPLLALWSQMTSVPLSDLLSNDFCPAERRLTPADPRALLLQRKMLGVLMRQARVTAGRSLDAAAATAGVSVTQAEAFEDGLEDLPVVVLELLASDYGVRLGDVAGEALSDLTAPAQASSVEDITVDSLPGDVRDFVRDPSNLRHLRLAEQVSRMPAQVLRELGQSLLDAAQEQ
jgi:transcriptional regulator with XRE-family HTH domain